MYTGNEDEMGSGFADYGHAPGGLGDRNYDGGPFGGIPGMFAPPPPPQMFAPYGGNFPFMGNNPSGQMAQNWMPPIMPPGGMPATPPQNLSELYSAYGAGPSGVMPGFLPPARPAQPSPPQGGGLPPGLLNDPRFRRFFSRFGGSLPFGMGGQQPVMTQMPVEDRHFVSLGG